MASFKSSLVLFSLFAFIGVSLISAFPFGRSNHGFASSFPSAFDSFFGGFDHPLFAKNHQPRNHQNHQPFYHQQQQQQQKQAAALQCHRLCSEANQMKESNKLSHSTYQSNYVNDINNHNNNYHINGNNANNNKVLEIRLDMKNNGQSLENYNHQVGTRVIESQPRINVNDLLFAHRGGNNKNRNLFNHMNKEFKTVLDVNIERPLSPVFHHSDEQRLTDCGCGSNNNNNNNHNNKAEEMDQLKVSFDLPNHLQTDKISTQLIKNNNNGLVSYYIRIPVKNNNNNNNNNNNANVPNNHRLAMDPSLFDEESLTNQRFGQHQRNHNDYHQEQSQQANRYQHPSISYQQQRMQQQQQEAQNQRMAAEEAARAAAVAAAAEEAKKEKRIQDELLMKKRQAAYEERIRNEKIHRQQQKQQKQQQNHYHYINNNNNKNNNNNNNNNNINHNHRKERVSVHSGVDESFLDLLFHNEDNFIIRDANEEQIANKKQSNQLMELQLIDDQDIIQLD